MSRKKITEWQPLETAPNGWDRTDLLGFQPERVSGHHRQLLFFKGTMVVGRHRRSVEAS